MKKQETKQEFYLLVDYFSWKGGTNNVQRARIVPVGNSYIFLTQFHSKCEKAETRARRWAKKHNITLVGD